jgi:hypothetical protein
LPVPNLVRTTPGHREMARLTADVGFAFKYPDLALSGDRVAFTFAAQGARLEVGVEVAILQVTDTPVESFGACIAWNKRRVGVAW